MGHINWGGIAWGIAAFVLAQSIALVMSVYANIATPKIAQFLSVTRGNWKRAKAYSIAQEIIAIRRRAQNVAQIIVDAVRVVAYYMFICLTATGGAVLLCFLTIGFENAHIWVVSIIVIYSSWMFWLNVSAIRELNAKYREIRDPEIAVAAQKLRAFKQKLPLDDVLRELEIL